MILLIFILFLSKLNSQEGLPIYTDYLTENYYLVHPSMAGVNLVGGKVRMTARKQWFDQQGLPIHPMVVAPWKSGQGSRYCRWLQILPLQML